jgi:acetoin utilization protein AcuB
LQDNRPKIGGIMDFTIENYMTKGPHTVGANQDLKYAEKMMKDLKIRHLPVLKEKELIGILSLRDIRLLQGIEHDYEKVLVEEACVEDPIRVQKGDDVRKVCKQMSKEKIGSVLVMDKKKLVGIFTEIDVFNFVSKLK